MKRCTEPLMMWNFVERPLQLPSGETGSVFVLGKNVKASPKFRGPLHANYHRQWCAFGGSYPNLGSIALENLTAVYVKETVFWDVSPWNLVQNRLYGITISNVVVTHTLFIIRYFLFESFKLCSDGQAATAVRSFTIPSVVKLPNIRNSLPAVGFR